MSSSDEFEIKPYPAFELAVPNMRALILGKSGAGKSIAMYFMAMAMTGVQRRVKRVIGFSYSEEANGTMGGLGEEDGMIPKLNVHSGDFKPAKATSFMDAQKQCFKRGKSKAGVVFLDDILHRLTNDDKKVVDNVMVVGRQFNTGLLAIGHSVKQLSAMARESMQVIIAFPMTGEAKKLYETFFSDVFETYADFLACATEIWNGGGNIPGTDKPRRRAIVIDKRQSMHKISSCVFCFEVPAWLGRAWGNKDPVTKMPKPLLPIPKLGSANKWLVSKRVYRADDSSAGPDPFDPKLLASRLQVLRGGGVVGADVEDARGGGKRKKNRINFVVAD